MVQVKKGLVIGRKKILRVYKVGAFTFVDTQCMCKHRTKKIRQALGMLLLGKAVSCRACWDDEVHAALSEARHQLSVKRQVEAQAIRERFSNS